MKRKLKIDRTLVVYSQIVTVDASKLKKFFPNEVYIQVISSSEVWSRLKSLSSSNVELTNVKIKSSVGETATSELLWKPRRGTFDFFVTIFIENSYCTDLDTSLVFTYNHIHCHNMYQFGPPIAFKRGGCVSDFRPSPNIREKGPKRSIFAAPKAPRPKILENWGVSSLPIEDSSSGSASFPLGKGPLPTASLIHYIFEIDCCFRKCSTMLQQE